MSYKAIIENIRTGEKEIVLAKNFKKWKDKNGVQIFNDREKSDWIIKCPGCGILLTFVDNAKSARFAALYADQDHAPDCPYNNSGSISKAKCIELIEDFRNVDVYTWAAKMCKLNTDKTPPKETSSTEEEIPDKTAHKYAPEASEEIISQKLNNAAKFYYKAMATDDEELISCTDKNGIKISNFIMTSNNYESYRDETISIDGQYAILMVQNMVKERMVLKDISSKSAQFYDNTICKEINTLRKIFWTSQSAEYKNNQKKEDIFVGHDCFHFSKREKPLYIMLDFASDELRDFCINQKRGVYLVTAEWVKYSYSCGTIFKGTICNKKQFVRITEPARNENSDVIHKINLD